MITVFGTYYDNEKLCGQIPPEKRCGNQICKYNWEHSLY